MPDSLRGTRSGLRDGTYLIRRAMAIAMSSAADRAASNDTGAGGIILLDIGGRGSPFAGVFRAALESRGRSVRHLVVDPDAGSDVVGTAERLPFARDSADMVLCTQVLEHVEDPRRAVGEIARVLKPGGCCVLSTHGTWFYHPDPRDLWRWTAEGLESLFRDAGFEEASVSPVGGTKLALAVLGLTAVDRAAGEGMAGALARALVVAPVNLVAGRGLMRRVAGRTSQPGELAINYLVTARRPRGGAGESLSEEARR